MRVERRRYLMCAAVIAAAPLPSSAQTVLEAPAVLPAIDKACRGTNEEVIVCGKREPQRSPYRIPEPPPRFDAGGNDLSVSRERHRLSEQGNVGIHSCTTVGPGGYTGCVFKQWKDGDEQWGGKDRGNRVRPGDAPPS